jgi:drug/metabolite transporter (DMT)-like permease
MVITTLGWAGAWLTARLAAHDAPPMTVTVGRFIVASAALLPAWFVLERGRGVRPGRREWMMLLGMSVTGIAGCTVLFLVGVAKAPASDGAILTPGLAGSFAMLVAFLSTGARPDSRALGSAILTVAGSALVGWAAARASGFDAERITGDLIFVASAAGWGVYTVLGRHLADRLPAITGVLLASLIGVILLAPIALIHDGLPDLASWSRAAVLNVVYLGLGATAVSFVTFYLAVKVVGIARAAPTFGLVPLFGVLGAAALLGERITPLHVVGGLLVVGGIVIPAVKIGRRREATRPSVSAARS